MVWTVSKILIASSVIALSSWLSGKKPALAGFIMALPISTLLALAFSHSEYRDWGKSVTFAKSILAAVPLSLLFFVPFLLADRLKWPFWSLYGAGVLFLVVGYYIHRLLLLRAG